MNPRKTDRRQLLAASAATLTLGKIAECSPWTFEPQPKLVAAVATIYRPNSHADVLIGKILEGWKQNGGPGPNLKLASIYVDQFPQDDLSVALCKKHNVRLCKSIRECLELDSGTLAVDGVLSIGEHGDYPVNELGQQLYPRRRFFEEICQVFERSGRTVPVFNDKHPGPRWEDAAWMAERAKQLAVPWMAGSSLTVGSRTPDVTLPTGESVSACLAIGYSGLDIYGFHTLDFLQCIVERRKVEHQGVVSVQSLGMDLLPKLIEQRVVDQQLLKLGAESSAVKLSDLLANSTTSNADSEAIFVITYRDGLRVPVLMLGGRAGAISVSWREGNGAARSTKANEHPEPRYPHFAYLLKAIETMIHTGRPSYPVERTLLAAGILDRALNSKHQGGKIFNTPELDLNYQFVDYPHAPHISLL
ncbi:MAG: hypothetical protein U0930_10900 [Pirellulales bacterium]